MARLNVPIWQHDAYTLMNLQKAVSSVIKDYSQVLNAGCVVDMGAGDAPYKPLFESAGARYVSCDIDSNEGSDHHIVNGVVEEICSSSADVVFSFQVLEHVPNVAEYLSECRRILKPGGKLILSTHGVWLYHPHPGDYRRWTRSGLELDLGANGFIIEKSIPCVGPLAWATQFRQIAWHHILTRFGFLGLFFSRALCAFGYARMHFEDKITPFDVKNNNAAVYFIVGHLAE